MPLDTRAVPALAIEPDAVHDDYDRHGFGDLSDAQLFERAATVVARPKAGPGNSFILHAPLELMARRLLLPLVPPRLRRAARERIIWVAARYEQAAEAKPPTDPVAFGSPADARSALLGAIAAGDVDAVDATATYILDRARTDDVMTLAEPTLDLLAAAGHAPIGFFLASRLATTSRVPLTLLRPTLVELARAPELQLHWARDVAASGGDGVRFEAALARTPQLGVPGSDFIFPLVHQVDANGLARDIVEPNLPDDVTTAAAVTLRVATRSMLQDDPAYAPYGWTHCLTLPHAILELLPWSRDRHRAAAIAATYVVAFRAALSSRALAANWAPEPVATSLLDALDAGPEVAAAAWYHAAEDARAAALPELAGRGACHPDAHVAKYTLACLCAASADPSERALYLAAAASLVGWWSQHVEHAFRDDL
jgi:hypothetical protein